LTGKEAAIATNAIEKMKAFKKESEPIKNEVE